MSKEPPSTEIVPNLVGAFGRTQESLLAAMEAG